MTHKLFSTLQQLYCKQVPATGLGLFRIFYGLVTLQEILFLLYFNHLIFDPIPFIDVEFPTIPFFLCLWGIIAIFVTIGYRYAFAMMSNYLFWIVFVNFTPMQRDFDGGFDVFMIGANFFLLFLPADRAFSLDNLRYKLSKPFKHYNTYEKSTVSVLCYLIPVAICLGFLYFDSAIHKLFAQHWRNGLGSWLPSTQPYYVSALDMSFLLNNEFLEKFIGYTILVFQFSFIFLFAKARLRPIYLFCGLCLHGGIAISLNIYPFGLGMLSFYTLMVPFAWWRWLSEHLTAPKTALTVFYDAQCPLCNRTALIINHFDIFQCIDFKTVQDHAKLYYALNQISQEQLLKDIYALDRDNHLYHGVDTYSQIFKKMRYSYALGLIMQLPIIHAYAVKKYRQIADNRQRITCNKSCVIETPLLIDNTLYHRVFEQYAAKKPKTLCRQLAKTLIALFLLQLNSTIHYGLVYRLDFPAKHSAIGIPLSQASNALIMMSQLFVGITPHALYVHDHFAGYDRIIAITYIDNNGVEQWLPFVNEQGRLLAPNWGRVHSMWANIAVTTTINDVRLKKFLMKVTAFWGTKLGLDLNNTSFVIKMKAINAPNDWVYDQLQQNFATKWVNIGSVKWHDNQISYELPADINHLSLPGSADKTVQTIKR